MAYGSIKSISDSIIASTDGGSIQDQIDEYMQRGDGAIANAVTRKDTGAIVKSLGARAKVVAQPAAFVIDPAASVSRDWAAIMMANAQDNSAINAAFLSDEIAANASSAPETTDEAFLQTGVLPADGDTGNGLMSSLRPEARPDVVTEEPEATTASSFYMDIGVNAESDHGSTPVPTEDAAEANLPEADRSKDIAFGHKIQVGGVEDTTGIIHGIRYKRDNGTYIALTDAQKTTILEEDMAVLQAHARRDTTGGDGWDTKLAAIGSSWDELSEEYQNVLTSLAYNVGGETAGREWTAVLQAAVDEDITEFALHLRRQDAGSHTAGMDNRVVKELYYSGLISNRSEVSAVLPLSRADSGVPD